MQKNRATAQCRRHVKVILLTLIVLFIGGSRISYAQRMLHGEVIDAEKGSPIAGASVFVLETSAGTSTDTLGNFFLRLPAAATQLRVTAMGYAEKIAIVPSDSDSLKIYLKSSSQALEEVHITARSKYSNQNNPAVALIQEVIGKKDLNNIASLPHYSYQVYEKIMMAASDLPSLVRNNSLFKNYQFIFQNVDTTLSPGRTLLPVYLEENLKREYRRSFPYAQKTQIEATNKTELDPRFINNENIQTSIAYLHKEVNLYDHSLMLFNRSFLSPIASTAPLFYRYRIQDTVLRDGEAFILMNFEPRNPEDRLFSGNLWISTDGNFAVGKAELVLDGKANINWINDTRISLEYQKIADNRFVPEHFEMHTNFGLSGSGQGMFSQWAIHFSDFDWKAIPAQTFAGSPLIVAQGAETKAADFWEENRKVGLTKLERTTYRNIDSLEKNKSFKRTLAWGSFIATSFVHLGPVELGPFEYAYSINDLEGNRFRVGGRTNRQLSDRFYAEGYTAYGTKDQKWKYFLGAAISLKKDRIAQFPAHYLHASYHYDAREPGQRMDFLNGDSFLRSFRSGDQDKWYYNTQFKLSHVFEFGNHWRLESLLGLHQQNPAGTMEFRRVRDSVLVESIRYTDLGFDLRWAPHEEYFQKNLVRSPIPNQHPIFNLRYNTGLKDVFGGEYRYHAVRFDFSKLFFLSQLGIFDVKAGVGYIHGSVPFSLLETPMANQTYLLTKDSYNMMNDLEFVSDRYAKFSAEHNFHGFFLNKIPLIKKLKLREIVGFKMFAGDLRPENQPGRNTDQFYFPVNKDGERTTFAFSNTPYMEASVGLENIFRVLRVEYVRRLNYLHHPGAKPEGVRFSTKIGF